MFWWFRSSFQILQNDQHHQHTVTVLSPTETLLGTYLGPIKDKPIHCIDLSQKGRNPWGTIPDPTNGIGPWIWVHFSCISSRTPSFSSPFIRQCQLSTRLSWFPVTKVVGMVPGAADQSAGMCELQRPVDTAARPWARGRAGLSEMLESSRRSGRETNKPSQLLGHCYLGNKNATCKSKSNGPLEFGNHIPESSSDLFANTAESYSSLSYCRKSYPSAKLL